MPVVHQCARPGCGTLTMGEFCLEHELAARQSEQTPSEQRLRLRGRGAGTVALIAVLLAGRVVRHLVARPQLA